MRRLKCSCLVFALAAGCIPEPDEETDTSLFGSVSIDVIAERRDGLLGPRDLDFNPDVEGELWVINRTDDAAVTIRNAGTSEQSVVRRKDPYALHFMEETSSLSFSTGMKFGTCGESRNTYDGTQPGNDFMGPALWSADDAIFAKSNPEAVDEQGFDLGSHLDMMHETPLCMGIAWVSDNVYFVFEGLTGTIARYDFKTDHGPGFDYHGDGTVERFVDVDVAYEPDVPSHLVYDHDSELLYVADTGNNRVGVLDVEGATESSSFEGFETMVSEMSGAQWRTLVRGSEVGLVAPSGLALGDGVLFVGDNATSTVHAFSLEGDLLESLELDIEEGGLMGLRVGPDGHSLWVTDFIGHQVLRIDGVGE